MRKVLFLIAFFVFVSLSFGYCEIMVLTWDNTNTDSIESRIEDLSPGDTLAFFSTGISEMAINLYIEKYIVLMRASGSSPITINKATLPGYPRNIFSFMAGGRVEGFNFGNNTDSGAIIAGWSSLSISDCSFLEGLNAIYVGSGHCDVENCEFGLIENPFFIEPTATVFIKNNYFSEHCGQLLFENTHKVFLLGNIFESDSAFVHVRIANCDSVDIARNIFELPGEGEYPAGVYPTSVLFEGANTALYRNNTVIGGHNGLSFEFGHMTNIEIYSNVFAGEPQCGIYSGTVLAPHLFSYNFYDVRLWGDPTWNVGAPGIGAGGDWSLHGDPMIDEETHEPLPGSSLIGNGYDGSNIGHTGGNDFFWSMTTPMSVPDSSADSSLIKLPEIIAGPNPFNSTLGITFDPEAVELNIFDLSGRVVESARVEGMTSYPWNAPMGFSSGNYLIRVSYPDGVIVKKTVTLVR